MRNLSLCTLHNAWGDDFQNKRNLQSLDKKTEQSEHSELRRDTSSLLVFAVVFLGCYTKFGLIKNHLVEPHMFCNLCKNKN